MTEIEWTDESWNPIVGCDIVSPGCTNCYAMQFAGRLLDGDPKMPHYAGTTKKVNGKTVWTGKVALAPEAILTKPLRWKKPRRVFVNSMGDLFHENIPAEWISDVFAIIDLCQHHTFQILTKRPERMLEFCVESGWGVLPNVWLGVSVEDQRRADERIPVLMETPAAKRFISVEPMLEEIRLHYLHTYMVGPNSGYIDVLEGSFFVPGCGSINSESYDYKKIDWVICGGESGKDKRPFDPDWARALRDQCQAAGVPFFFKQMDKVQPIPDDLMIREFPA